MYLFREKHACRNYRTSRTESEQRNEYDVNSVALNTFPNHRESLYLSNSSSNKGASFYDEEVRVIDQEASGAR